MALLAVLACTMPARAQDAVSSLYPAGAQRGTSVDVAVEGKGLGAIRSLYFSHPGITAKLLKGNRFSVTVDKAVPEGDYDVWAVTAKGLTNPRRFAVGSLPEIIEKEKNDEPKTAEPVKIPVVINGTLAPGTDADYFQFDASAGQQLAFHFRSESLDGSVRPALTVFNAAGKEILHDDGRDAEPMLEFTATEAGSYQVRVEERSYQLGDNGAYRLAILNGPRLVGAFPQVLSPGRTQPVSLYGYQLPGGKTSEIAKGLQTVQVDVASPAEGDADGGRWTPASGAILKGFRYQHPGVYGAVRFGLEGDTIVADADAAHANKTQAQAVPFPVTIAGRFLNLREVDWYRLNVKKGQLVWIDAIGERAGKPMDLEVSIHNAKGDPVLTLGPPGGPKKGEAPPPVPIRSADPLGLWKVEADGDHYLVVRDFFGSTWSGVTRTYQVNVGKRREEVSVVAFPGSITIPAGGSATMPIVALRRGGHEGPIRVYLKNVPAGLDVQDLVIPAKDITATWTLKAKKDATEWTGPLTLLAETELEKKKETFPVVGLATVRGGALPLVRRTSAIVATIQAKP